MDRRADVVDVARPRQLLGPGTAAGRGLRLHHEHLAAGERERDRGNETVGPCADDDCVVLSASRQGWWSSGMWPLIRVPEPGAVSTISVPPTAPSRSRMFTKPCPPRRHPDRSRARCRQRRSRGARRRP